MVLKNTEKQLIEILSAFVNDKKPKINETECSSSELYEIAKRQTVTGISSYVLRKYGYEEILAGDERLALAFDKTVTQFVRKELEAVKLMSMLNAAQIPHITFKGFVVRECYPVTELRTYSDIDIIIKEEDRKKSHELMLSQGYEYSVMDGGAVYGYKKNKEFFEIHTTLNSEKTKLSDCMSNYWNYTVKRDGFTYEFEKNFHLSYLVSHIEKHVYGTGAGLRLYLDIALFLKKYKSEIDLDKVREILRSCELERFFDTVLYLCRLWFESDVTPLNALDEDVYEEFCRIILEGGTFGDQTDIAASDNEIRRAVKENGKVNKFALVMKHIFPSYNVVRHLYPFFNGKPYLLPVGWVIHLVDGARRSGLKNIRKVVKGNVNEANKEKMLLERIGSSR